MPLLTAAELKASREAIDAGVTGITDADANQAISEAEAFLYSVLGFRIEVPDTTLTVESRGDEVIYLPERVRTITALTRAGTVVPASDYRLKARGWVLHSHRYGWAYPADEPDIVITGAFGFAADERERVLATKVVRILAVRWLKRTMKTDNIPSGASGSYLTSYTTEGSAFTFFTPTDSVTGDVELDPLVEELKRAKPRRRTGMVSVPIRSTAYERDPFAG